MARGVLHYHKPHTCLFSFVAAYALLSLAGQDVLAAPISRAQPQRERERERERTSTSEVQREGRKKGRTLHEREREREGGGEREGGRERERERERTSTSTSEVQREGKRKGRTAREREREREREALIRTTFQKGRRPGQTSHHPLSLSNLPPLPLPSHSSPAVSCAW